MSETDSKVASELKSGGYIVIKKRPCKITSIEMDSNGDYLINANDIFITGKQYKTTAEAEEEVEVPKIAKTDYRLLYIDEEDFLVFEDTTGSEKSDVKLPEGSLGDKIREEVDANNDLIVTTTKALGEEVASSMKLAPKT
ncbi:eukaryotic translation initiation factor [Orbilia ellipsospora]|uniref:Eukaryotic translation initiation factor n=1 Tax=Orbilia ellipsospora TaxID=2528407 RepID=A0AAV9WUK5_9PEZI